MMTFLNALSLPLVRLLLLLPFNLPPKLQITVPKTIRLKYVSEGNKKEKQRKESKVRMDRLMMLIIGVRVMRRTYRSWSKKKIL